MIGFIGTSITVIFMYNDLSEIAFGGCLRLVPFLPGPGAFSLPLLIALHE
jgi:hypothetical protein